MPYAEMLNPGIFKYVKTGSHKKEPVPFLDPQS